MIRALGYGLLIASCIAWAALPIVPFMPLSGEQKLAWGAGLYIFGQVTWFGCLPLVGRDLLARTRQTWKRVLAWLRPTSSRDTHQNKADSTIEDTHTIEDVHDRAG